MYWLIHRLRRQASSHRGECSFAPRLCCCSAFDLDLGRPVKPRCPSSEPGRGDEWWGKSPFGYFWGSFPKVTRRKGGTNSRRDRSNGYVHNPRKEWFKYSCRDGGISGQEYLPDTPLSRASPLPHKPTQACSHICLGISRVRAESGSATARPGSWHRRQRCPGLSSHWFSSTTNHWTPAAARGICCRNGPRSAP